MTLGTPCEIDRTYKFPSGSLGWWEKWMTSCPGARPSSRCDLFGSGVSPGNQVQGVGLVGLEFVALRPVGPGDEQHLHQLLPAGRRVWICLNIQGKKQSWYKLIMFIILHCSCSNFKFDKQHCFLGYVTLTVAGLRISRFLHETKHVRMIQLGGFGTPWNRSQQTTSVVSKIVRCKMGEGWESMCLKM